VTSGNCAFEQGVPHIGLLNHFEAQGINKRNQSADAIEVNDGELAGGGIDDGREGRQALTSPRECCLEESIADIALINHPMAQRIDKGEQPAHAIEMDDGIRDDLQIVP
jgi:hypothetical protein